MFTNKRLFEDVDYTQMSDEEVQKDLGIRRSDEIVACDVVADYAYTGDGSKRVSEIDKDLVSFIQDAIGDESASVKIKGTNDGGTPIYSASVTSSVVSPEEIYDFLKSASNEEYELRFISKSEDDIYEEEL